MNTSQPGGEAVPKGMLALLRSPRHGIVTKALLKGDVRRMNLDISPNYWQFDFEGEGPHLAVATRCARRAPHERGQAHRTASSRRVTRVCYPAAIPMGTAQRAHDALQRERPIPLGSAFFLVSAGNLKLAAYKQRGALLTLRGTVGPHVTRHDRELPQCFHFCSVSPCATFAHASKRSSQLQATLPPRSRRSTSTSTARFNSAEIATATATATAAATVTARRSANTRGAAPVPRAREENARSTKGEMRRDQAAARRRPDARGHGVRRDR